MRDKTQERVLVVPTARFHELGVFQGFTHEVEKYLPSLLEPSQLSYRPRAEVETDPSYKQLIPYIVLRWQDQLFHYTRGKRTTEDRLRALRSVGVGGHINPDDDSLFEVQYRSALFRELHEELTVSTEFQERCVGLLNDDSNPVGEVHLGIVHLLDLAEPKAERKEQALTRTGFAPLAELRAQAAEFETWSRLLLEEPGLLG